MLKERKRGEVFFTRSPCSREPKPARPTRDRAETIKGSVAVQSTSKAKWWEPRRGKPTD